MKTKLILLIGLFLFGFGQSTEAQIFKKLGKKVEQKVKERIDRKEQEADRKIDQKIDEGMDKAEDKTQSTVLDWIQESDKDNSSKASSPQIENAPEGEDYNLKINGSGPDYTLFYTMDTDLEQQKNMPDGMGNFDMSFQVYSSTRLKRSRSEVLTKIPIVGEMRMATLINLEDPDHIVMINDKKKTYAIISDPDQEDANLENYRFEIIGKETLYGLKTTHFRIVTDIENFSFEMWTSKDLPGYKEMLGIYKQSGQMGNNKIWKEIIEAGADGYVVKIESQNQGITTRMKLYRIEKTQLSNSLFEIPKNYKRKDNVGNGLF